MSNVRKSVVSNCEKKFLIKSLSEWTRLDGRAFDEFRKLHIEFGKEWGCCSVTLGETRVVAQVSCTVQEPKSSRPSEGLLNVNIELSPIGAPHFEAGRQSDFSVQLNRLLEKCLKDSKAVDLESLCIKTKEKVWAFRVDVNVLNHEGNILDCASIAALAALAHFRRPDCTCDGEEFIIHSMKQRDPIPTVIHHYPVCITYAIFSGGDFILADPTLLEEGVADAFLTVGLNAYKELCGLHLGGKAELSQINILVTTQKAANRAVFVVQQIKDAVEKDNIQRQDRQVVGFHKTIDLQEVEQTVQNLELCLDQWSSNTKRKKYKKDKAQSMDVDTCSDKRKSGEIESLGKGSAALIPNDDEKEPRQVWNVSSEDEEDVEIVQTPAKKIETVDLLNSEDSEEETVVVLNADKKTNKKGKKMKI